MPWPFIGAALVLLFALFGYHTSRRGKFVVWDRLLGELEWTGAEQVLDVGCGRGAVLMPAASRLTTGRAVGIDLWRGRDQSGNAMEATWKNAVAEGVADHVELRTADMTELPFEDESFDVIVSSMAVHNLKARAERDRALTEAVRVLRPGGRLLIADLRHTGQHCETLHSLGMSGVSRRGLGWRMWWSGPWLPTHLATATKPR
nr:class I SAM-dependent methyltransferase [Streptomyces sp. HNM0575]